MIATIPNCGRQANSFMPPSASGYLCWPLEPLAPERFGINKIDPAAAVIAKTLFGQL
jgi:hypothetical protein